MNRQRRLSKIKHLFDILLMLTNSIGIVGALMEILDVPYSGADRMTFWAVLFFFCMAAVLFWDTGDKKKCFRRFLLCAGLYVFCVFLFRTELTGGFFLGLRGAASSLNERYQFHLTWPDGLTMLYKAGWERSANTWIITFAMLAVVFPFIMLGGLLLKKGRLIGLALGNVLWFTAACTWDVFPDFFFLVFCVLGAAAALVKREFGDNHGAGLAAVAWVMTLSGLALGAIYFFLMPVLDEMYTEGHEDRIQFYRTVNEEWIPWFQSKVSGFGIGSGTDVTGALHRQNIFAYTSSDIYQVTVNAFPKGTLYLKSFVGATYGKTEWKAFSDNDFEQYCLQKGFELPENYGELINITYEAMGAAQGSRQADRVRIEELAGAGSYSVYPYGALLTQDFTTHADGSVERKSGDYSFLYRYPQGFGREGVLTGDWSRLERQYREYVYDSFLDYPEELEQLTEALRQADIRTDSVYHCASDIMVFLDRHGDYDLDAGKNPSGKDFVEYFLFDSHEGYCVHFASAGVLALRYFGIPARYVTGYVAPLSDFTDLGGGVYTAVVKSRQAHAWAEIYLDGIGWVPVEMTPGGTAVEDNRVEQMIGLGELSGEKNVSPPSVRAEGEGLPPEVLEPAEPQQSETAALEKEEQDGEQEPSEEQDLETEVEQEVEDSREPESEEEPEKGQESAEKVEKNQESEEEPNQESEEVEKGREPESEEEQKDSQESERDQEESQGSEERREPERDQGQDLVKTAVESVDWHVLAEALLAVVLIILLTALVLLGRHLRRRAVFRWRRRLKEAGAKGQVLLLYQNLRRVLGAAGCSKELEAEEEAFRRLLENRFPKLGWETEHFGADYDAFCQVLVMASFGNREPSQEEVEVVVRVHDGLVREAAEKIPLYKKPLLWVSRCYVHSFAAAV